MTWRKGLLEAPYGAVLVASGIVSPPKGWKFVRNGRQAYPGLMFFAFTNAKTARFYRLRRDG